MPGIYGIYSKTIQRKKLDKVFHAMGEILHHRKGYIRDEIKESNALIGKVSFQESYVKPVWNNQKTCVILLDGAIFSYVDELGVHEVEDHELILKKLLLEYNQTGRVDIKRLNGEFNLVLYDKNKLKLFISNDRWGFRELYYLRNNELVIFAPEVKAILCHPDVRTEIEDLSLVDFLHCGYILNDRTFFKNILLSPPGSTMVFDENSEYIYHHEICYTSKNSSKLYEADIDNVYHALDKAVERRTGLGNEICVTLSGGLDSRLILGIEAKYRNDLTALTLGDKKCQECKIARKVVSELGLERHITVEPKWKHLKEYSEALVWLADGMLSLGFISTSFGAPLRHALQHDLLIGGFGGDHTIGGSRITKQLIEREPDRSYLMQLVLRRTRAVGDIRPFAKELFTKSFYEKFMDNHKKNVEVELERAERYTNNMAYQQEIFLFFTRYRRLLNQARGLVGHAVTDEYYPYFDNDFIDTLYSLPAEYRYQSRLLIEIYKRYLPNLAKIEWLKTGVSLYETPSPWVRKTKQLSNKLRWYVKRATRGKLNLRNKTNYAEHDLWYRTNKEFRKFIDNILLDDKTLERSIFKREGIIDILGKMRKGFNLFGIVDRMIILELFFRIFLDNNVTNDTYSSFLDFLLQENTDNTPK